MLHYHGLPIHKDQLPHLAGQCICVSFAHPEQLDFAVRYGQSVMLDNGAFSLWTRGAKTDWDAYRAWIAPHLYHPHWCVIPDVIGGSVEDNAALMRSWSMPRELSLPAWHMKEPLDWLAEIARSWGRFCIATADYEHRFGTTGWELRLDRAWETIEKTGAKPWVHKLQAMGAVSKGRWPFASADSTRVARNHYLKEYRNANGADTTPALLAKINAQNPRRGDLDRPASLFAQEENVPCD